MDPSVNPRMDGAFNVNVNMPESMHCIHNRMQHLFFEGKVNRDEYLLIAFSLMFPSVAPLISETPARTYLNLSYNKKVEILILYKNCKFNVLR